MERRDGARENKEQGAVGKEPLLTIVRIKREGRAEDGAGEIPYKPKTIEEERELRMRAERSKQFLMRMTAKAYDMKDEAEERAKKVVRQRDRARARCERIEDELETWKIIAGVLSVTLLMLGIVVFLLAGARIGFVTAG